MKIIRLLDDKSKKEENFFKILYDERLAEDTFWIPESIYRKSGGLNPKVKAKQIYELLLRLADAYCIEIVECSPNITELEGYARVDYICTGTLSDAVCTDCYIIAKYKDRLLAYNCFGEVVESVLNAAQSNGLWREATEFLEKMLRREKEYYRIDDALKPILIYKGEDICYNVLNHFAEQFGAALERMGQKVEYFDTEEHGLEELTAYIGKHYRAIVGMQTYLFSITMQDGSSYLHDRIYGPKFNFVFDHPIWVKKHLEQSPKDLCILTHDENYVNFCRRHYGKKACLFPPAGSVEEAPDAEKRYDISFVGSYGDYWNEVILIHQMDRKTRFLANRFLLKLRKEPQTTADEVFRKLLCERKPGYTEKEYMNDFFCCRRVIYCAMHYYRIKVIKTILDAGYTVDVFGDSWKYSPLCRYPNLRCHPDVTIEESMGIWRKSKISLNIMSWHKGGFTERMANIMLCKTVLLTDYTTYLENRFLDGRDLLVFRLDQMEKLPEMLKTYFDQPDRLCEIAKNGYKKANAHHTWDSRAREFVEKILEEESCGME